MVKPLEKRAEIRLKDGTLFKGLILPSSEPGITLLKQEDGYNVALPNAEIASKRLFPEAKKPRTPKPKAIKPHEGLPKIAVIHTGGTIASRVDYTSGGVTPLFSPEELLELFPELEAMAQVKTIQLFNVLSEHLDFRHYNQIGRAIAKLGDVKGIIVTHGTDTMHYTSSALSFMLEGLSFPVVLVGSQRSSDRGSSDAAINLLNAAYFITKTDYKGVAICMHASSDDDKCLLLKPHNARKMHTSARAAFRPINTLPIAEVDFAKNHLKYLSDSPRQIGGKLVVKPFKTGVKVGVLKSRPGIQPEELATYNGFDGLLLEGTGLGHFNLSNPNMLKCLSRIAKKIPVVMASQCAYGRCNLRVYSTGRQLLDLGIIPNEWGLTAETAYIKLAWLLSNYSPQKVRELFNKDIRGENITRITPETFLY